MPSRWKIIVIVLASVVLAGGCSDDGDGGSPFGGGGPFGRGGASQSGLLGALGRVRATDSTRSWVEYGDVARIRSLADSDKRFLGLTGSGMGQVGSYFRVVQDELGFDPLSLREAMLAGSPPDSAAILWGDYDVDAVNRRLGELGVERVDSAGSTTWIESANGDIRLDGPLSKIVPIAFGNLNTRPGSFAFSSKRDTLAWVTEPGGDTLAKDPTIRGIAECLGDVISATITPVADTPLGVGVRASSTSDVSEVVCVRADNRQRAEEIRDHVTGQLKDGTSPRTGRPWSELLPGANVELTGQTVRVVARSGQDAPPGVAVKALMTRELEGLLGLR